MKWSLVMLFVSFLASFGFAQGVPPAAPVPDLEVVVDANGFLAFKVDVPEYPGAETIVRISGATVSSGRIYDIENGSFYARVPNPVDVNKPYWFRASYKNSYGEGPASAPTASTEIPFAAPTGLRATRSGSSVTLTWNPVPGAKRYKVASSTVANFGMPTYEPNVLTNSLTIEGVTEPRFFAVRAVAAPANYDPEQSSAQSEVVDWNGHPVSLARPVYQSACPNYPSASCPCFEPTTGALGQSPGGGFGPQAGDPVNLANGAENYYPEPDLVTPNRNGVPAIFSRAFRSGLAAYGLASPGLTPGWAHNYDATIWPSGEAGWKPLVLRFPNGSTLPLNPVLTSGVPTGTFAAPDSAPIVATGQPHSSIPGRWNWIQLEFKDESRWRFAYHADSNLYVLQLIYNRVDQGIRLDYNADRTLWRIRDATSLELLQSYGYASGRLASILDQTDGPSGRVNYRRVYLRYMDHSVIDQTTTDDDLLSGIYLQAISVPVPHTTSATAAADRVRYDYSGRNTQPYLSSISKPSATGFGWASATIGYDVSPTGDFYRVNQLTDGNGNKTVFTYQTNQTLVEQKDPSGVTVNSYTQKFDAHRRGTGQIDAEGNEVTLTYGTWGTSEEWLVKSVEDAKGNTVSTTTYDAKGNPTQLVDALGIVTTLTWNYSLAPLGRLMSVQEGSKPATTFTYDSGTGLTTSMTGPSPAGGTATTTFSWDVTLGNLLSVTSPSPVGVGTVTSSFDYTTDGTYSQGARFGQPIRVIDPFGKWTSLRYDAEGNLIKSVDANGVVADYGYDISASPSWVQAPATGQQGAGRGTATYTYQYVGGPLAGITLSDEAGANIRTVLFAYGHEGELIGQSGGEEDVLLSYDAAYRQKTLTDALGRVTTTFYNSRGLPSSVQLPGGDTIQYNAYDANGNLTSATDANGLVRNFVYTGDADLLTGIIYPTLSGKNVTLGYDALGRLTSRIDKAGTYGWTYGDLDEELTETITYTGLPSRVLTTTYRPDGSRATLNLSGVGTYTYNYNGRGELLSLTDPFGANHGWTYLDNGWLATQTSGNGAHAAYTYNALGQPTQLTNRQTSGGSLLSQFTTGNRDGLGSLLQLTASVTGAPAYSGTTSWSYNAKGWLTQETSTKQGGFTHPYALDGVGNLTQIRSATPNRTYNTKNQISNAGFGYNANGNATTFASNTSTWDELDKLTSYGANFVADYRSDGLRASKGTGSARKYYLYDGGSLLAELDSTGTTVTAVNTWGANGLVARRENSVTTYYQFDLLGGTVNRLNSSGVVVGWHTQNAYGIPTNSPATADPYQGRGAQFGYYRDSETGLYWTGYRVYDAINCRFLSRDPIGYEGGINVYRYAGGNPIGRLDPSGLDPVAWGSEPELLEDMVPIWGGVKRAAFDFQRGAPGWGTLNAIGAASDLMLFKTAGTVLGKLAAKAPTAFAQGTKVARLAPVCSTVARGGAGPVRAGQEGLRLAGVVQNTQRIKSLSGTAKFRVPDFLDRLSIGEVKKKMYVSYTKQLHDYLLYARMNNIEFVLHVPDGARISGPLQRLVDVGDITLRRY